MSSPPSTPAPQLQRQIGGLGAVGLGLGSILGTGVFVSLSIAAGGVGPGLVPAVLVAALLATANGLSSAQLAAAYPVSGGTYEYGYRLLGPTAGRTAGWCFLLAKSASAATAALGASAYLLHLLGRPRQPTLSVALAVGLTLLITVLVAGGVRRSNLANGWIVAFTLVALITFVVIGGFGSEPRFLAELRPEAWGGLGIEFPRAMLQATALVFVAYTGYGRIATLGEEVRRPKQTIPRAILATLAISAVLYLAVAATAIATVGSEAFAAATQGDAAPLEQVARTLNVPGLATLLSTAAVTAMMGVLLNLILGSSRVVLAMARRRDLPFALSSVREASRGPRRAVLAVGLSTTLLTLIGDVRTTWSFSAATVLVYYGLTNLACLRLAPEYRLYPRWIAIVGLATCLALAPMALLS